MFTSFCIILFCLLYYSVLLSTLLFYLYLYLYLYLLFPFMLHFYFYFAWSIWNKNNFPPGGWESILILIGLLAPHESAFPQMDVTLYILIPAMLLLSFTALTLFFWILSRFWGGRLEEQISRTLISAPIHIWPQRDLWSLCTKQKLHLINKKSPHGTFKNDLLQVNMSNSTLIGEMIYIPRGPHTFSWRGKN